MTARKALTLPVLAGVLAVLLVADWLRLGVEAGNFGHPPVIPAAATDDTADANGAQWANAVLARPVLSASRRPAPAAGIAAVDDTLPRLSAIIVIGGSRHAIFAAAGQKPQLVAQGGEIGVYRIKTLAADRVDLLGPDGLLTLKPQFVSGAPATSAPSQ